MDEYICLTILGNPTEEENTFKARLAEFWTYLLRNLPDHYEQVYAEATRFGVTEGRVSRQYMVGTDAVGMVTTELTAHHLAFAPVDPDDTYTKYEAASPDWFQIEH